MRPWRPTRSSGRRRDRSRLSPEDARQLAASLAAGELDRLASDRLARGPDLLHADDELALFGAVMASVVGLGRIQPYLDSPDVSDIHIRGCDSVWLKLHDGSRVPGEPVADTDDELIELVRLAATRMGRSERRFDAANPELNLQLPDGTRLFATMEVSARPSVVIRRHRFELSSLDELADARHGRRRAGRVPRAPPSEPGATSSSPAAPAPGRRRCCAPS